MGSKKWDFTSTGLQFFGFLTLFLNAKVSNRAQNLVWFLDPKIVDIGAKTGQKRGKKWSIFGTFFGPILGSFWTPKSTLFGPFLSHFWTKTGENSMAFYRKMAKKGYFFWTPFLTPFLTLFWGTGPKRGPKMDPFLDPFLSHF